MEYPPPPPLREEVDPRLPAGYRRQGVLLYHVACPSCSACEPIRLRVAAFEPNKTQRRILRRGRSFFDVEIGEPEYSDERLALYNPHKFERGLARTDLPMTPARRRSNATRRTNARIRSGVVFVVSLAALLAGGAVQAQDVTTGRSLAATCANCHGTNGRAEGAMAPLAGYPPDRLVAMLADFRSGKRPATIMHQIAKGYTDTQVAAIAAFFATQKN